MVLRSSQSDIKLPSIEMLPDSLKSLLDKIKQRHYEELYELEADSTTSLQDDLNEILQAFRSSELESSEFSTLMIIQSFVPDWFFNAEQQKRLSELMNIWRTARDRGETLPAEQQTELDKLVEAELKAATARTAALVQQINS